MTNLLIIYFFIDCGSLYLTNLLIILFFYWLLLLVYWHLEVMDQDSLSSYVRYLSLIFVGFLCFCLVLNLGLDIHYVLLGFQS